VPIESLTSAGELADLLGVTRQAILFWNSNRERYGFPEPLKRLASGYVWDVDEVERWARRTGRWPPKGES
jgi:hypothetical protein